MFVILWFFIIDSVFIVLISSTVIEAIAFPKNWLCYCFDAGALLNSTKFLSIDLIIFFRNYPYIHICINTYISKTINKYE